MKSSKILADVISSATGAKTHFDVWWAQMSEAKPQHVAVMNEHRDFFLASQDAHYTACFIYLAHLFDKRSDSSSIPTYLAVIRGSTDPTKFQDIESCFSELARRATPLVKIRHKLVAHVDVGLSEKDVFDPLKITWKEVRSIIYDTVGFVEELAGAPHQGAVGIPRDGRLSEGTSKLLRALKCTTVAQPLS